MKFFIVMHVSVEAENMEHALDIADDYSDILLSDSLVNVAAEGVVTMTSECTT